MFALLIIPKGLKCKISIKGVRKKTKRSPFQGLIIKVIPLLAYFSLTVSYCQKFHIEYIVNLQNVMMTKKLSFVSSSSVSRAANAKITV